MNPLILIILLLVTLYFIYSSLFPQGFNSKTANSKSKTKSTAKADDKKPVVEGSFTPRQLSSFNGHDKSEIFIAVKGKVYDVSNARSFYGPSGPYSNFAGHDASRGLAKNSFEFDVIPSFDQALDDLKDLSTDEWAALNDWEALFKRKYPLVGELVEGSQ